MGHDRASPHTRMDSVMGCTAAQGDGRKRIEGAGGLGVYEIEKEKSCRMPRKKAKGKKR